jgi:outer membrane protein
MKRLALGALIAAACYSSVGYSEDLLDVYQLSVNSDPTLLAEAASRDAVGELKAQARAAYLPQVNLTASETKVWQQRSAARFSGNVQLNEHGYTLSITQPIYRRANLVQQEQADIAIEGADASYFAAQQALIVRVAERYFDVLKRQDDLAFAKAELEAIAKQQEQTKLRFEVGLATITDVTESQAAYDLANASLIAANNELANSRERLRETSGKYLQQLTGLESESPLVSPQPADIDEWSNTAIQQNPTLLVAASEVNNAKQTIELRKSGHYPTLDVVAQKNYSSQSDSINNIFTGDGTIKSQNDSIGLQFNLPIYLGGSVNSQTREARFRLEQAMQNEEQQRRMVMRQTREAYNGVIAGISQVKALKQAVLSNEKALESSEAGYEVGTRTTVDVLNARRNLFSARRDYAASRYDYIVNSLRLKQAAGIVSVDDLQQINQWLAD